jgi:hypothetical protein
MLSPIVRLTLYCGLGHSEFAAAVRRTFIDVASSEYGVRGRPANIARISAKTGLPRKAIQKHRSQSADVDWTPDDEASPLNTLIHYWRFDKRFCRMPGEARELPLQGEDSFTTLARSCVGDIPVTTLRKELIGEGIATEGQDGLLRLSRQYSFPDALDADFLRNAAFSIGHLADTLYHNALLVDSGKGSVADHLAEGRFERFAWSRRLSLEGVDRFQRWVRSEGSEFIQRADEFVSEQETERSDQSVAGVGVYFFRDR